jgi:hypothetical protein
MDRTLTPSSLLVCVSPGYCPSERTISHIKQIILNITFYSVSIVNGYGLGNPTSISDRGGEFSSALCVQPALRPTQPTVQRVLGVLSPGIKCRRDAYHSPPYSAEVKKERGYSSSPPKRLSWRIAGQLFLLTLRTFNYSYKSLDVYFLKHI